MEHTNGEKPMTINEEIAELKKRVDKLETEVKYLREKFAA
jgi:hypothetical protein